MGFEEKLRIKPGFLGKITASPTKLEMLRKRFLDNDLSSNLVTLNQKCFWVIKGYIQKSVFITF